VKDVIDIAKHFVVKATWFPNEIDLVHTIVIPNIFFLYFNPSTFPQNCFSDQLVAVTGKHAKVLVGVLGLLDGLLNFSLLSFGTVTVPRVPRS